MHNYMQDAYDAATQTVGKRTRLIATDGNDEHPTFKAYQNDATGKWGLILNRSWMGNGDEILYTAGYGQPGRDIRWFDTEMDALAASVDYVSQKLKSITDKYTDMVELFESNLPEHVQLALTIHSHDIGHRMNIVTVEKSFSFQLNGGYSETPIDKSTVKGLLDIIPDDADDKLLNAMLTAFELGYEEGDDNGYERGRDSVEYSY